MPEKTGQELTPQSFDILNQINQEILQGMEYTSLPFQLTIDPILFESVAILRKENPGKKMTSKMKIARERLMKHLENNPTQDPDLEMIHQRLIHPGDKSALIEFSHQSYMVQNQINHGKVHSNFSNYISFLQAPKRTNLDGIDDKQAVVHSHNHDSGNPFTREDIIFLSLNDEITPNFCLYYAVLPGTVLLAFPTKQTPRANRDQLKAELEIPISDEGEASLETHLIEKLDLENKSTSVKRLFKWYADIIEVCMERQVGLYFQTSENNFEQITNPAQILHLLKI